MPKVHVKRSKPHRRGGGWVKGGKGYVRKKSKVTVNKAYDREPPKKRKKKKPKEKKPKKTRQTRFGTPRGPARKSIIKRES